jgi:hypothetical protein
MSPENSRNTTEWTPHTHPVPLDVVEFRKLSGQKVRSDDQLYATLIAMVRPHFTDTKQQEIIQPRAIEKPEWFIAAESDARSFMSSLGFNNLGEIYFIEGNLDGPLLDQNVDAYHDSITRNILASEAKLTNMLQTEGLHCVTSVLVHELTHDTAPKPERIVLQQHTDSTSYEYRNGWTTSGVKGDRGSFLEEGFCEYVAGLYRRQKTDPDGQLLPINYRPSLELPSHLKTEAIVAGPDAHALELMAWAVENRGIMSAELFIGYWFDSRKTETQTRATREIIKVINSLSPELYPYLRDLEYSAENWTMARNAVYKIITR